MTDKSIDLVYVQARDGVPQDEAFFKAWDGFGKRGVPRRLFEAEEFEPRKFRWRRIMTLPSMRDYWADSKEEYSPRFRAEVDRIVREVESGCVVTTSHRRTQQVDI